MSKLNIQNFATKIMPLVEVERSVHGISLQTFCNFLGICNSLKIKS
jgi:hypothetical protein